MRIWLIMSSFSLCQVWDHCSAWTHQWRLGGQCSRNGKLSRKISVPFPQHRTVIWKHQYLLIYIVQPCNQFLPKECEHKFVSLKAIKKWVSLLNFVCIFPQTIEKTQDQKSLGYWIIMWRTATDIPGNLQEVTTTASQTSFNKLLKIWGVCHGT